MEDIRITLADVSSAAGTMRSINASLDDTLNSVSKMMNDLSSVWKGTAGEAIVQRF